MSEKKDSDTQDARLARRELFTFILRLAEYVSALRRGERDTSWCEDIVMALLESMKQAYSLEDAIERLTPEEQEFVRTASQHFQHDKK